MRTIISLSLLLITLTSIAQTTKSYEKHTTDISKKRKVYHQEYISAETETAKKAVITKVENYLFEKIDETFTYWYGTPWDFNGVTRTPKSGKIACGYFVTIVLNDVGFKIPRVKWAQSASEVFIKKLSSSSDIKRFSNKPIEEVKKYLLQKGNGIYIVGLDVHTGYIKVKDGEAWFIHSSYYKPEIGVLSEKVDTINPLSDSNYVVIGKLLSDEMILNWMMGVSY